MLYKNYLKSVHISLIIALLISGFVLLIKKETKILTKKNEVPNVQTCNLKETEKKVEKCTVLIETNIGRGSGILYKAGYIITNKHVIESASDIKIVDSNLKTTNAKLWNYSKTTDVAILKGEIKEPICNLIDKVPEKGEEVIVVGYPEEIFETKEVSITKGTVSKVLRDENDNVLIKTDAAINKGNSGGPMANACGIIGINTYTGVKLDIENLGYAISFSSIIKQIPGLMSDGGIVSIPKAILPTEQNNIKLSEPTSNRIPVVYVNKTTLYCYPDGVNFVNQIVQNYNQRLTGIESEGSICVQRCLDDYKSNTNKCQDNIHDVDKCISSFKPIYEKCGSNCVSNVKNEGNKLQAELKTGIPTIAQYCQSNP